MFQLVDFLTKKPVSTDNLIFTGKDPWEVVVNLEELKSKINVDYFKRSPSFVSKYLPFMPIKDYANFVSLKEGSTPLMESRTLGKKLGVELYFKLEGKNPTSCFKDRGTAVEISLAKELGAKAIAVASTGNMAASCACYAAAAQIPCFVFVPEDTPPSKLSQSISYGGRIVQVKGAYNDAANLAEEVAKELGFYLAGDYAYRVEGAKTAAFELIDQLLYNVPDVVIVPMGCGTNITAFGKGFHEYKELGFIDRLPQLIGTQASGSAAIVNAFNKKEKTITPLKKATTLATAICVANPLDGIKALDYIYKSNGSAMAIEENEILEAQYMLAKEEGLFVESSSATTLACLLKHPDIASLKGKKIVCVITGDGLKDPGPILKAAIKPPTIYPDVKEFISRYEKSFFEGKTFSFTNKDTVLFSKQPTAVELEKELTQNFGVTYSEPYLVKINDRIEKFLMKGKSVTLSDLQDIVQDAQETLTVRIKEAFSVQDFEVITSKDKKPIAKVTVKVNGSMAKGESDGVGPVDAVINAMKVALKGQIEFALAGYKVDIRSSGTDAVVYVEMKLTKGDDVSVGQGTSPDILQASIEAFEEAYNGFYN